MLTSATQGSDPDPVLMARPGKWQLVVATRLRGGTLRFTELRRDISGISQKALTTSLRDLERDGFISRTLYATIPPRVEYALTDLGRELVALADELSAFAHRHAPAILAARKKFDALQHAQPPSVSME